jgi:hypothetical protein
MSQWAVEDAAASAVPTTAGWARAACPLCEESTGKADLKRSFSVSLETGYWTCFKCGESGWLEDRARRDSGIVRKPVKREVRPSDLDIPEGSVLLASQDGRKSMSLEGARTYIIEHRRFGWETIVRARVFACMEGYYANRLIFPVTRAGKPHGFIARSWSPKAERAYLYPRGFDRGVFFNGDALDEKTDQPLFVVEGVFDALRIGPSAIACLGKPTGEQIAQLTRVRHRPVVVALDADAWRTGSSVAMTLRLRGVQAVDLRLPPGKDPDSLSADWFLEKATAQLKDQ